MEILAQHGVLLPPNMQGLTEEQVDELKLKDEFAEVCIPSGGFIRNPDPVGRRNGRGNNPRLYFVKIHIEHDQSMSWPIHCSTK